jgi:cell division inhibitor SulA
VLSTVFISESPFFITIFAEGVLTPQQQLTLGWLRRGSGHIESALLILLRAGQQAITIHKMTAKILRTGYTKLGHHPFSWLAALG